MPKTKAVKSPIQDEVWKWVQDEMRKPESFLEYLYTRWQDEGEYEDIEEYGEAIKSRILPKGFELVRMFKRPFGFVIRKDGKSFKVAITATTTTCSPY
jgi:hypothetical protein